MAVKIELEQKECNTIANALFAYMKHNKSLLIKDKDAKGKKLTKALRTSLAKVNETAGKLHRFFLIVSSIK